MAEACIRHSLNVTLVAHRWHTLFACYRAKTLPRSLCCCLNQKTLTSHLSFHCCRIIRYALCTNNEMSQDTTAKEVLKLYQQAVAARRRTHMRFPDQDPEAITRLTKRLKIFDLYGQASCRYICQEILRSLPPELCDVIIEYVIDHNDAIVKVNRICEPVYANTRGQSLEHHWKVEYVGRLMLARMMTVWYRNSNFVMHGTQYWREDWRDYSLRVFLNEEAPCLYLPRYRLITKISVTIHASSITVDWKQENRNWNGANSADLRPTWGQVVQGFEALFQLRSGASIQIIVHGSERIGLGDDRLDDILATCTAPILESMSRLKRAGYILSTTLLVGQRSFGYSLCEPNSLDEDAAHVPAGETGLIWRPCQPKVSVTWYQELQLIR